MTLYTVVIMPPPADIEAKVDKECSLILKTDSEFWEIRNKAMLSLLALAAQYEGSPPELCQKAWNLEVFRILKDPIKSMVRKMNKLFTTVRMLSTLHFTYI